jgi:hypothetical protein
MEIRHERSNGDSHHAEAQRTGKHAQSIASEKAGKKPDTQGITASAGQKHGQSRPPGGGPGKVI